MRPHIETNDLHWAVSLIGKLSSSLYLFLYDLCTRKCSKYRGHVQSLLNSDPHKIHATKTSFPQNCEATRHSCMLTWRSCVRSISVLSKARCSLGCAAWGKPATTSVSNLLRACIRRNTGWGQWAEPLKISLGTQSLSTADQVYWEPFAPFQADEPLTDSLA